MTYTEQLCKNAKAAEISIRGASQKEKILVLETAAKMLVDLSDEILAANETDMKNAEKNGVKEAMLDRLLLTKERVRTMADGILKTAALPDPVGKILGGRELANGLKITKVSVPLGVVGIIYESRPNVTADAAALCLKSGNVAILRGGSDAFNSCKRIADIIRAALGSQGLDENAVCFVEDTSRETVNALMKMNKYIDVLIPRGGAGLIQSVKNNSTVPVIETGTGNCSVYIDESADTQMALKIADNAKTSRPSVCNAAENLIVHKAAAGKFLPALAEMWRGKVKILGDKEAGEIIKLDAPASDEDYATEFLDRIISIKTVDNIDEAIAFINKYGTRHSECIVTKSLENAEKFQKEVDAAAVYVNASTRFTDGGEFGFGAEIGISTQKLHARGPMGLEEMTTYKYLINGNGQIRS